MSLLGQKEGQRFLGRGNSEDGRQARSPGAWETGTGAELGLGRTEGDLARLGEIFLGRPVQVRNPDFILHAVGREFHDLICIF